MRNEKPVQQNYSPAEVEGWRESARVERLIRYSSLYLPEGWKISLCVNLGNISCRLYFKGREVNFEGVNEDIAANINAAINFANKNEQMRP